MAAGFVERDRRGVGDVEAGQARRGGQADQPVAPFPHETAQAIACCTILKKLGRVKKGLVIVPASLKPQWAREWAGFTDLPIRV